jgi:RNA polymerase-binding transcription factor DksA
LELERERIPEEKTQAELEKWLEEQRERLEELRSTMEREVFGEGQQGATGELTTVDQHPADTADFLEARERTVAVESMLDRRRRQVEMALEKLRRGEYGICERCRRPINPERLSARPDAIYCIDCQRQMEQRRP